MSFAKWSFPRYFHQLFYRERFGRLSEFIEWKKWEKLPPEEILKLVVEYTREAISFAEDETICHNICKGMYFCEKKKRHSGNHAAGGLAWD